MATGPEGADETDRVGPGAEPTLGIRRRELLIGGGAIAGVAVITRFERDQELFERLLRGSGPKPTFTARMLRPEDMLAFDLEFYEASYEVRDGIPYALPTPVDGPQREDFVMVAVFGPQAVAEEPLDTTGSVVTTLTPPHASQVGGPSRLAFSVRGLLSLEDQSLLNFVTLNIQPPDTRAERGQTPLSKKMLLVPAALTEKERKKLKGRAGPQKPKPMETSIEAPFRMMLSPALNGSGEQFWRNRTSPLLNGERSELWHTRLVNLYCLDNLCSTGESSLNGEAKPESEIRAVWTPGWSVKPQNVAQTEPFTRPMALTPRARSEIVSLSSNHKTFNAPFTGKARLLTLSALGASLDLRFDFPELRGSDFDVTHWSNRATLGRDHYVKVVESGYLFPLGHAASLITISERQIEVRSGNSYAVVRKRQYLVLKEKSKRYTSQYTNRAFPFGSVTVVDDITPLLDEPKNSNIPGVNGAAFWPRVSGRDYLWTLAGTDPEGIRVEFQAPLIFVKNSLATAQSNSKSRQKLVDYYLDDARSQQRRRPLGGQSVAYAQSIPGKARQTAFATDVFELSVTAANENFTPRFLPRLREATIATPALAALGPEARLRVKPSTAFLNSGFDQAKNAAQAYLTAVEKVALDYTKDAGAAATGALGAPNMNLSALSRTLGPLGGDLKNGTLPTLKPADFFAGATFLGIKFTDVLPQSIPFPDPTKAGYEALAAKVPRTLTETIYEGGTGQLSRKIPKEIRTEFIWEPELKGNGVFIAEGRTGRAATMLLRNVTVVPISEQGAGKPRSDTTGEIKNFGLSLFGKPGDASAFLIVYFNRFEFRSRNDQKPDVHVDVDDVVFAGPLEFVNGLRQLMKSTSGGTGIQTDITPGGVVASYGVDFPSISTGLLSIQNISLGAGIEVPFDGKPVTVRFNFCKVERPFLLIYTIFGGGGFANVAINSKGVESLTVSLEFGAAAAIDLGVASGSVQVMAGIIIKVEGSDAMLTGFVRLRGELDILGLINVSLEFLLSLTYDSKTGEAWGRAKLTVEVEVFCFSKSVTVEAEKRLKGGGGGLRARALKGGNAEPPAPISFADLYTTQDWDTYRSAFAPAAF